MAPTRQKICVLDDDNAVRHSVRVLLESYGLEVEDYATAREFLAHVPSGERSCLLLDLYMPEMDGVEVLGALERQGATLPVIIMTGRADSPSSKRALKAGACALLDKPFDEHDLLDSIQAVLDAACPTGDRGAFAGPRPHRN